MDPTHDRVRESTATHINRQLDDEAARRVDEYSRKGVADISRRIQELDKEWDTERVLETNASALAFVGLFLGVIKDRRWFALPAVVLPFLFQHATQGWCPPLPVLRRLGVRTRKEINREKVALKALRGDFAMVKTGESSGRAAFEAARY